MRKGGMMGNGKGPERGGYPQGEHQAVGQHLAADDTGRGDELFCGDVHHDAFRRGVYQGDRYRVDSEGNQTLVEEHYYADESEDASSEAPVSEDSPSSGEEETTTTTEQLYKETLRSEMSPGARVAQDVICSILTLLLLAAFPYSVMWTQGDKDNNSVHFGHMAEDKLRGLKVGALAAIPSAAAYILLILSKLGVLLPNYYAFYRFMNVPFMPILDRLTGGTALMTAEISWGAIAAMLMTVVFVPLLAHVGYWLGYKEISLVERFIYVNPNKKKRRRR